jgi:molybdopterin synthase sulfur carrier subunit
MIQIQFFSLLRLLLNQEKLELPAVEGETVAQLLDRVQEQVATPFLHKLLDDNRQLHAGTIILVNRRNVLHLEGLETSVKAGDVLAFFPPGAGG